jgi:hypothetical protein
VVRHKGEFASSEVSGEMLHAPDGSLHFKKKRGVIALMFLQLSACISNDTMFAVLVDLREDGSEATRLFVIAEAGVDDEGIGPVSSGVVDNWLGAEVRL